MKTSSKRAQHLAIFGAVLSVAGFLVCFIIGAVVGIVPAKMLAWQILGGSFIWVYLAVFYRNRDLADQEKLDAASLRKSEDTTIFQSSEQREALFSVAQKRYESFSKWGPLIFSVLIAVYSIFIGFWLLRDSSNVTEVKVTSPLLGATSMVVMAFFSFLIARYATGMSVEQDWRPLKAGGSYLLGSSLLAFLIAIGLALQFFQFTVLFNVMAWVVPIIMIVYGIETVLNTVFDIYRPRIEGQYHRIGFDSRILGIINEPGSVLHTAATTIDYQFGFKVSQTWLYQLLEKAILPLLLLLLIFVYLSSSIIEVGPGQMAVIERFGSTNSGGRIVGPGLHIKWPWPVDIANIHDTERVQQINIGFAADETEILDEDGTPIKRPLLWGQKHYETEYKLLVATENEQNIDDGAVPVSLIIAVVPIQYKVNDVYSYLYRHTEPKETLRDLSYREVARFMASAELETGVFADNEDQGNQSVLGAGREAASRELLKRIQQSADEIDLGVEIVMVGLEGIHPPLEVAADYERVIGAIQQRQRAILDALSFQNKTLTELGGSIPQVDLLYELAVEYEDIKDDITDTENLEKLAKIDKAFEEASGEIFKKLSEAKRYSYERVQIAKATGERFASQVKAYEAAPEIYKQNQRLNTLEEVLSGIRKYVIVSDENDSEVMIIDLQESLSPSLYDIEIPE
jgi:modulator of FtsH protease HflK